MDYPKSVPGVGLVGGKFVDEDAQLGRQGSLIPAVWGNAVTEEVKAVIVDAGHEPAEADHGQLKKAIRRLIELVRPVASDADVSAGTDDSKVVTPKKLRAGFAISFGDSGYIAFPSWLSGVILQWGAVLVTQRTGPMSAEAYGDLPIPFPNSFWRVVGSADGSPFTATSTPFVAIEKIGLGKVRASNTYGSSILPVVYIAIGR